MPLPSGGNKRTIATFTPAQSQKHIGRLLKARGSAMVLPRDSEDYQKRMNKGGGGVDA